MEEHTHDHHLRDGPVLEPPKHKMPIFSWVGLISLALSLCLFGWNSYQNDSTLERVEDIAHQNQAFLEARAPETRASLCNLLNVAVAVLPQETEEQRRVIRVLNQNAETIDCPSAVVELPNPGSPAHPSQTTRSP